MLDEVNGSMTDPLSDLRRVVPLTRFVDKYILTVGCCCRVEPVARVTVYFASKNHTLRSSLYHIWIIHHGCVMLLDFSLQKYDYKVYHTKANICNSSQQPTIESRISN